MRLRLNAEQVTLSACSTALGRFFEGEGIVGLTRGFLYAGADSVVVSLWNVSDTATAELMRAFYTNLNRGLPRGEALRQAKLKMVRARNLEWTHPYFWAPFVLVGKS
jgi:CHAT domain-containing protein